MTMITLLLVNLNILPYLITVVFLYKDKVQFIA